MVQQQASTDGSSNGSAILVSVLAAGAAGLAGAALWGRPSRQERAQAQIEQQVAIMKANADESAAQISRALDSLSFDRDASTRKARKRAQQLQKSSAKSVDEAVKAANQRIARMEAQARNLRVREQAKGLASHGSDRVSSLSASLGDQVNALLEEARQRAADAGNKTTGSAANAKARAKKSSRKAAKRAGADLASAKKDATKLADDLKVRGSGLASAGTALLSETAGQAGGHAPEVKESLTGIVETVAERGSEVIAKAREQAPDLAAKAKERAPELADTVAATLSSRTTDLKEHAKPLLGEIGAAATHAADQAIASARDASKHLAPEIQAQADSLGERVTTGTHVLGEQSKQAATAAGRGAKETGALLAWSAAAGAVVYAALLDDRQRQKLKESGQRVVAEMREVIADIRGYDEEFA